MATNPLGLQRSGDVQTDLDLIFANLQYLRDSLPQTTALDAPLTFSSASLLPVSSRLAATIASRVKFELALYVQGVDTGGILAVTGPVFNYLRYESFAPTLSYNSWDKAGTQFYAVYRIVGVCEPQLPGILQATFDSGGMAVTISPLSNLTITLL